MDEINHGKSYTCPRDKEYELRFKIIKLEGTDLGYQIQKLDKRVNALEGENNQATKIAQKGAEGRETINDIKDRMQNLEQTVGMNDQHPLCLINTQQIESCQEIITNLLVRDEQRQNEFKKLLQLNENLFDLYIHIKRKLRKITKCRGGPNKRK